jgi:hypothetical protein
MRLEVLEGLSTLVETAMWVMIGIISAVCLLLILRGRIGSFSIRWQRRKDPGDQSPEQEQRRRRMRLWFWDRGYRRMAGKDEDEHQ